MNFTYLHKYSTAETHIDLHQVSNKLSGLKTIKPDQVSKTADKMHEGPDCHNHSGKICSVVFFKIMTQNTEIDKISFSNKPCLTMPAFYCIAPLTNVSEILIISRFSDSSDSGHKVISKQPSIRTNINVDLTIHLPPLAALFWVSLKLLLVQLLHLFHGNNPNVHILPLQLLRIPA